MAGFSVKPRWDAGGDARHHYAVGDGDETAKAPDVLCFESALAHHKELHIKAAVCEGSDEFTPKALALADLKAKQLPEPIAIVALDNNDSS